MKRLTLAMVVASLAIPAAAQTAADPSDKPAAKQPNPNKRECRHEAQTGSLISRSTCHTRAEWAAIDDANSKAVDSARHSRMSGGAGG